MYKIIGADRKQYGPVSAEEVRQWIAQGRADAQTLIQAEGQTDWRPLASFPEFALTTQPVPGGPVPVTPAFNALAMVSGPAIALMVVGILCVLGSLWGLIWNGLGVGANAFGAGHGGPANSPQMQELARVMSGGLGIFLSILNLAISAFIIFASVRMKRLKSYGLVFTATILAMIPCTVGCCCIAGLPVGIWSLVVLLKPEVKSAFH